jgi:hypothetical protein
MKNKHQDLNNHLFAALEALHDLENPMDVERAKAIAMVGNTLIASAKLEIEMRKLTDGIADSGFFVSPNQPKQVRHEH